VHQVGYLQEKNNELHDVKDRILYCPCISHTETVFSLTQFHMVLCISWVYWGYHG